MLSKETFEYIENTSSAHLKKWGQFFTKKSIRDKLMSTLEKIESPLVLEPSCGTGEFLHSILNYFDSPQITAVEIDSKLAQIAKKRFPEVNVYNENFFKFKTKKYDFIIGNPPYYRIPSKEGFDEIAYGRVNIYHSFFKLGIDCLKKDGVLAFVVPSGLCNGIYASKLRKYIINHTNIEYLKVYDSANLFDGANQRIMIIVLKKTKNTGNYVFKDFFTEHKEELKELYKNSINLKEIGCKVKTGSIVWNQHKQKLTNNKKNTLLVWGKNICDDHLIEGKFVSPKGQYIKINETEKYPAIVVQRTIGNKSKINCCIINEPFLAENHVNVIHGKNLKKVLNALQSKKTKKVIKYLIGSTMLSKTELEKYIPIF